MTESTGGSDVGLSRDHGAQGRRRDSWRLYGRKWFTSAITSQMALTLARPQKAIRPAAKGWRCSISKRADEHGGLNRIAVNRLKDKLGTRKVPTAELTLEGAIAIPVLGLSDGVKNISPMLNVTRTWNSVSAVSYMRRGYRVGARLREQAHRVRRAARRQAAASRYIGGNAGGVRGCVSSDFLLWWSCSAADEAGEIAARRKGPAAAAYADRQAHHRASSASRWSAKHWNVSAAPAMSRTPGCRCCCATARCSRSGKGTTNVLSLDALRAVAGWRRAGGLRQASSGVAFSSH